MTYIHEDEKRYGKGLGSFISIQDEINNLPITAWTFGVVGTPLVIKGVCVNCSATASVRASIALALSWSRFYIAKETIRILCGECKQRYKVG